MRRVRSIALVHEILSREAGEDVPFLEIVHDLTRMAEEAFAVPERPIRCIVEGDPGRGARHGGHAAGRRAQRAAAERRRPRLPGGRGRRRSSCCALRREGSDLVVEVDRRRRRACPDGFDLDAAGGLGLSIVRTLVTSELAGTIEMAPDPGGPGHLRRHPGPDRGPPRVTSRYQVSGARYTPPWPQPQWLIQVRAVVVDDHLRRRGRRSWPRDPSRSKAKGSSLASTRVRR